MLIRSSILMPVPPIRITFTPWVLLKICFARAMACEDRDRGGGGDGGPVRTPRLCTLVSKYINCPFLH